MSVITDPSAVQPLAVTVPVAAVQLSMSEWSVRELIRTGQLRARSTGKRYIIPVAQIEAYLAGSDSPIQHPNNIGRPA